MKHTRRSDYHGDERWMVEEPLLRLGWPEDDIAEAVGWSQGSIRNDVKDHGGREALGLQSIPMFGNADKARRELESWRLYAELVSSDEPSEIRLATVLDHLINADKTRAIVEALDETLHQLCRPDFRFAEPWHEKLVMKLAPKNFLHTDTWRRFLPQMTNEVEEMNAPCIAKWMLAHYDIRNQACGVIGEEFEFALEHALTTAINPRREFVVRGIFQYGKTQRAVGKDLGVVQERARQLVTSALRKLRKSLKTQLEDVFAPIAEASSQKHEINRLALKVLALETEVREMKEKGTVVIDSDGNPFEPHEALEMPVENLEISVRAQNCLSNCKITKIGQLVQWEEHELMMTKGMGRKSLNEIKDVLYELGLRLGIKLPEPLAEKYPSRSG